MQVIFEWSIKTGKLPADWCKAQVTPVFKSFAAEYRLISLTCMLRKALKHILASHLVKRFNKHDLQYNLQQNFREKRSCKTEFTMLV